MKNKQENWEETMAKLHKIFYEESDIEISLEVNRALEEIERFIRKEKEESFIDGMNTENVEWCEGRRCTECGGEKKEDLSSICWNCLSQG